MQARILIASTTWWAMPARIAGSFSRAGARVVGLIPQGSPVAKVHGIQEIYHYSAMRPLASLSKAIETAKPDIIIPCDDRVVEHLHELYDHSIASQNMMVCGLIERSLGSPKGYPIVSKRGPLLALAQRLDIHIPETRTLRTIASLREFIGEHGLPVVLKIDGTWGGTGVRVLHSLQEADEAFEELTHPLSLFTMLRHACHHDFFPLFSKADRRQQPLVAQAYIEGKAANIMLACWQGDVLDTLSVETLFAIEPLGSSTIVRTIQNSEMEQAGRSLVQSLALTGFCGLDFMIESASGKAFLIELNPRTTQNGHLEPGGRPSLITVFYQQLLGARPQPSIFVEETIAFFPQILDGDPRTVIPISSSMVRDVPWDDPQLIKELMQKPWNRRHTSSMIYAGFAEVFKRFSAWIR